MKKIRLLNLFLLVLIIMMTSLVFAAFLKIHGAPVCAVSFSNDGRFIAGANEDGDLVVWRLSDWKDVFIKSVPGDSGEISVSFSADSKYLAVGAGREPKIYRTGDWQEEHELKLDAPVKKIAFSPYGNYLATGDHYFMRVFRVPAWNEIFRTKHPRGVNNIAFSSDGKYLVASAYEKEAHIWELPSFKRIRSISLGEKILSLAVAPYTNYLALGGSDTMRIFHLGTWAEVKWFRQDRAVYSLGFSPYGEYMAAGESDCVVIYDIKNGWSEHSREFVCCPVTDLEFSLKTGALGIVGSDMEPDEVTVLDTTQLNITLRPPPPPPKEPIKANITSLLKPGKIVIDRGKADKIKNGRKGFIFDTETSLDGQTRMVEIAKITVISADQNAAICEVEGEYLPLILKEYRVAFPE
ncbi:MAG: hypothetical protein J7M18_02585 [Candidatus Eremiobacteraeota bacterium]|nr:hypothetical protein [Candidatus Eremiobacteraeota bacterium]